MQYVLKRHNITDEQLIQLIEKYLKGIASEQEKQEVENWFESLDDQTKVFYNDDPGQIRIAAERSLGIIQKRIVTKEANIIELRPKRRYRYIAVAASILVFFSIGGYFILH